MNPEKLKDRLVANIYSAGIPASANDIERVISQECLERVASLHKLSKTVENSTNPDYLADWDLLQPLNKSTAHENGAHFALQETSSDEPLTIGQLSRRIKGRQISPVELTKQTLNRISEKDPQLNAFQSVLTDQALRAAEQAETEISAGRYRGPLHGIPVAIKDLIAMTGTIRTSGSILNNQISNFNAGAVDRLLKAGAIIVGKTRLSEFAYWPGSSNPHYGPTSNPHNLDYDAGGSSSGSGAAVAAGIVCAALGSDTGGSIRIPATLCGLVGLKATFGRVSLSGCTPLAWSLDHLGPLTANVKIRLSC
jgi:Asp-tRNA(Asn)/Glu-tRNA(Gln) amidotransferase A subunit family amidase